MSLSGFNLKHAFGREKPQSSVANWIEIMTQSQVAEESYECMPELVDAIDLQPSGPIEVARALRKKIKHGGHHQQYRAIVIMRLLVDNVPQKIKNAFNDTRFTSALRGLFVDIYADKRTKKKLTTVLLTWQEQFKDDASMSAFAGLHARFKMEFQHELHFYLGQGGPDDGKVKQENEKKKEEQEAEKNMQKKKGRELRKEQGGGGERRRSFNFERDKVKVTSSIVKASQASSNLMNAIKRANLDTDTLEGNEEVQSWLAQARDAKKVIVQYIQLVENEELIGTLIETNERLQEALNTYTQLTAIDGGTALAGDIAQLSLTDKLNRIQADDNAEIQTAENLDSSNTMSDRSGIRKRSGHSNNPYYQDIVHPDLADLDFSPPAQDLPPPLRPTSASGVKTPEKGIDEERKGSLSDYSDYESSDGETHTAVPKKNYVTTSDNMDNEHPSPTNQPIIQKGITTKAKNPFADPFS